MIPSSSQRASMNEVELGTLAQQNSHTASLKQFGGMMVTDNKGMIEDHEVDIKEFKTEAASGRGA